MWIGPIVGITPAALGAKGIVHAHATFGIHAPFRPLYAMHSVNCCAAAHYFGVSAGARYHDRPVGRICVTGGPRHPRPHPNAPCGASELSDFGPFAVSARRDAAGDTPVFFRKRE